MDHPLSISKELAKILRIACVLFTAVLVFFILTSTNKADAYFPNDWYTNSVNIPYLDRSLAVERVLNHADPQFLTNYAHSDILIIYETSNPTYTTRCSAVTGSATGSSYPVMKENAPNDAVVFTRLPTGGSEAYFNRWDTDCSSILTSPHNSNTLGDSNRTPAQSDRITKMYIYRNGSRTPEYASGSTGQTPTGAELEALFTEEEYEDPDIWIGSFGLARVPQPENPRPECIDPKASGRTWFSVVENAFGRQESLRQVIFGEVEGGWAAAQVVQPNGTKYMRIYYWHGTANLEWTEPSETDIKGRVRILTTGTTNRGSYWLQVSCNQFNELPIGVSATNPNWNSGQHATISGGTSEENRTGIIFVSGSYNPNYPDGYTGKQIPNEGPREYDGNRAYAKYDAITDSFSLKATYNGNEYDDSRCTYLTWRSVLVEDPEQGYNPTETQFVYKKLGETYETVVGQTGFFRLDLEWGWASTTTDFEKAGLNPSNLSYCQEQVLAGSGPIAQAYNQGLLPANYGKVMPIDGLNGESFDEANPNKTCQWEDQPFVETGFYPAYLCIYETSWTLKDCSVYGIEELNSLIGCHIGNFFNTIRHLFQKYFIPRPAKIQNSVSNLSDSLMENSSFLTYPLAFILNIVEDVSTADPSCTINVNDIYGASASWNLCSVKTSFPAMWTLATTVFRMGLTILFIVSVWRGFLNMFALNNKQ